MEFDFLVVGSGLCGSLAARHLEDSGRSVLVLEAGPALPARLLPGTVRGFQRAVAPIVEATGSQWSYRAPKGFQWHRVRARGGRTLLWGGWMERPTADYFEARRKLGAPWPRHLSRLRPWIRRAEEMLFVRPGKATALHRRLSDLGFAADVKRGCVLPTQPRMLTAADLRLGNKVRCDAPVRHLESRPNGVLAHLCDGDAVTARRVMLAASPIETARIVESSLVPSLRRNRLTFADHLIAGAIAIAPRQPFTPHPRGAAEASAVIHPEPTAGLRFTLEVRGPTPLEHLDPDDLAALGFTAKQAAQHSFYVVFAMGETDAFVPRELQLMPRVHDALGRATPRFVHRRHTVTERRLAQQMNERCLEIANELAQTPEHRFLIYDALDFSSGGHEVGTCVERVSKSGEVLELPGVYIADGAAVPAATDRHPSLTLAANALRVAEAAKGSLCRN